MKLPDHSIMPNGAGSNKRPLLSVVICSHNRADCLGAAIESLIPQADLRGKHEILVVNNRSTDRTREVVRRFEYSHGVRHLFEAKLGLCHARNRGWQEARGQIVAYLDDDAIAGPGWLDAIEQAFASAPGLGVVGGRVEPIWEAERPTWLSDDIALSLTILDWSSTPKFLTDLRAEWLVGANMAIPAWLLAEVGGFHPGLDRVGKLMLSSGDVFLQKQITAKGYACLYYPKMTVRHRVPATRVQQRWFIRRYYAQGLSDAMMQIIEERLSWRSRLRWALSKGYDLLSRPGWVRSLVLPADHPERFKQKCFALIRLGYIAGLLGVLGK